MILLLNLLPVVLVAIGGYFALKYRSWKIALGTVLALFLYAKAQPSYMPKGEIKRSEIPAFEVSTSKIEDRNRKPVASEVRDATMKQKVSEGLDFLKETKE